jgi:hypothetical protein
MPVGAIIGAAGIGAGSSLIAGGQARRGAERAADAQADSNNYAADVTYRMNRENIERLEPFRQFSMSAMSPLADLLGLDYQAQQPQQPQNGGTQSFNPNTLYQQPDGSVRPGMPRGVTNGVRQPQTLEGYLRGYGAQGGAAASLPTGGGAPAMQTGGAPAADRPTALEALQERPGYQFRFNEGQRMLDASAASRGMIQSGSAIKGALRYGQDYASNEYDKEISRLSAILSGGQYATQGQNASATQAGGTIANLAQDTGRARASAYQTQGQIGANTTTSLANTLGGAVGYIGGNQGWW